VVERAPVVVIGAGPAGIAAARAAADMSDVLLIDDNPRMGGQIWRHPTPLPRGTDRKTRNSLRFLGGVEVLGTGDEGELIAQRGSERVLIEYESLVLATGARERYLPFPGWTLPNVMGAGGLQALVKSGLPVKDKRVVVAGTGPLLLAVAAYLKGKGARVLLIAEQATRQQVRHMAPWIARSPSKAVQAIGLGTRLLGVPYRLGSYVARAEGSSAVEKVLVRNAKGEQWIDCDYLAMGYHLVPNVELAEALGCEIRDGFVVTDSNLQTTVESVFAAGELTGIGGVQKARFEGFSAGESACGELLGDRQLLERDPFSIALEKAYALRPEVLQLAEPDTIVCRCEDVRLGDLAHFQSWREAKLQTRCGMGPCQGRVCGPIVEALKGWKKESVRPPVVACRVGSLIEEENEE
jgi:D-hydroxyproline dehydrogenase subunit alpha